MEQLSERRRKIIEFVNDSIEQRGFPPTVREIGQATGISSTSVVDFHLRTLEEQGFLRRIPDVSRGIELLSRQAKTSRQTRVPIVGTIAAGSPIEAVEGIEDSLPLAPGLFGSIPPDELFALRIKGDSMIDELIGDGDLVVARRQSTAEDGDIVVALLADGAPAGWGATLKRFFRQGHRIRLQPANPNMKPIYVKPSDLQIQGKVVALMRMY
jgi:repressor LexA